MLSRSAERVYWLGRYLERAENSARIVQQYSQLLLDLPEEVGVEWRELVGIFGASHAIQAPLANAGERTILDFLLADAHGGFSLLYSIRMARDNIRNSRDLLPQESWESANELYQYARDHLVSASEGRNRFETLSECIGRCQQINGILIGTMSHDHPFHFLSLGQNIERADMTSRIIDVAAAYLQQNEALVLRYGSTLWTNVLKSVSGFQMYRQYYQPVVEGLAVVDFLLNDRAFPRAISACIGHAREYSRALPGSVAVLSALDEAQGFLPSPLPDQLDGASVSQLMDGLQRELAGVHDVVVATWFRHAQSSASA
jgi:uncharacterized alpha-E superfamily protein